jgi:hypothetical protein
MESTIIYGYAITYNEIKILFPQTKFGHLYSQNSRTPKNIIDLVPNQNVLNLATNRTVSLAKNHLETTLPSSIKMYLVNPTEENTIILGIAIETCTTSHSTYMTLPELTKKQKKLLSEFLETNPAFSLLEPDIHFVIKKIDI